ncbi:MAG: hypothetical protein Q4D96_01545 [Propionibacteriaceae bacterium]|nr:hypothetical protein [Propionibacteriaceae bacterium]
MKIDTSELEDWPDPETIFNSASSLMARGGEFHENIEGAHSAWKGLSASDNYVTPHSDLLYSSLDPALEAAQHASDGCISVKVAMTLFVDQISTLKPERDSLEKEAAAYNNKEEPTDPVQLAEHDQEGLRLQVRVNDLGSRYNTAINECANQLSSIGDDGLPEEGAFAWKGVPSDFFIAALAATAETRKLEIEHVAKRFHLRIFGVELSFERGNEYTKTKTWNWEAWRKRPAEGSFLSRFAAGIRNTFLGPPRGSWGPTTVTSPHGMKPVKFFNPFTWFGKGMQETTRTYTGVTGVGRAIGRSAFGVGLILTYSSEHEKMDKRFREEHPELTADERRSRVVETATVRTGAQVFASAAAGAAVGSALPVAGTAVGLAVGLGVGLAMSIPTGDDKTLGDHFADVGEGIWNFGKKLFGGG